MAQKTWRMKLLIDSPELTETLETRLGKWNEAVAGTVKVLMDMRSGRLGPTGTELWLYSRKSVQSDPLSWLTSDLPVLTEKTNQEKYNLSDAYRHAHLNASGHTADGAHQGLMAVRAALPNAWGQMHRRAIELIKSYEELCKTWRTDHKTWVGEHEEWKQSHPHYRAVRPIIEAFQAQHGAARGSRIRWAAWGAFLLDTPELSAWRKPDTVAVRPTDEQIALVTLKKPKKKVAGALMDLVFELNPELAALDREHKDYERRYARTYARRRHPDGFRHRPSFTLPSVESHPDWPRFKAKEGWQNFNLENRTVELSLGDGRLNKWTRLHFGIDRRLAALCPIDEPVKINNNTLYTCQWQTPAGDLVPAQPQGLKLIKHDGAWHLHISVDIAPPPCAIDIEQKAAGKYAPSWQQKKLQEQVWTKATPLITCAVDLGIRDLGAASIAHCTFDTQTEAWSIELRARRILHNRCFVDSGHQKTPINIPALPEIARTQRQLRRMRRATGTMAPEKASCARMAVHYRNMQEDRFKKAVAAIFLYARHHGASAVIFEDMEKFNPDSANERGINAALARWNRGAIVSFAEQAAEGYGLRVFKVPPYWTSRICPRCDAMGTRFDRGAPRYGKRRANALAGKDADALRNVPRLHYLGHWFVCPNCGHQAHADLNASENIHRVLLGTFPKVKPVDTRNGRSFAWTINGVRVDKDQIENGARRVLGLDLDNQPLPETPF